MSEVVEFFYSIIKCSFLQWTEYLKNTHIYVSCENSDKNENCARACMYILAFSKPAKTSM